MTTTNNTSNTNTTIKGDDNMTISNNTITPEVIAAAQATLTPEELAAAQALAAQQAPVVDNVVMARSEFEAMAAQMAQMQQQMAAYQEIINQQAPVVQQPQTQKGDDNMTNQPIQNEETLAIQAGLQAEIDLLNETLEMYNQVGLDGSEEKKELINIKGALHAIQTKGIDALDSIGAFAEYKIAPATGTIIHTATDLVTATARTLVTATTTIATTAINTLGVVANTAVDTVDSVGHSVAGAAESTIVTAAQIIRK